jgi:hypothetical protein
MIHYTKRAAAQFNWGPFTDLFILGTKRKLGTDNRTYGSDFTAAATTQTFTLLALAVGDAVIYPLAHGWVKQKFTDHATEDTAATTLANLKCDVGVTGSTTKFIAGTNADLQAAVNTPITPPVAAGAPHATTSAVNLLATLTSTAGNMSTITYGELWLWVAIARLGDFVRDPSA